MTDASANWGSPPATSPSGPAPTPYTPVTPPANAAEAAEQLAKLSGSEEWRRKALSGDGGPARELRQIGEALAGADPLDRALANIPPDPGVVNMTIGDGLTPDRLASAVDGLRNESGLSDQSIRELIAGESKLLTPELLHLAATRKRQAMADSEWVKRLLAGGGYETQQLAIWNACEVTGANMRATAAVKGF